MFYKRSMQEKPSTKLLLFGRLEQGAYKRGIRNIKGSRTGGMVNGSNSKLDSTNY